ncbi:MULTISPECIES: hypothetical protein [unclassified Candidatus Cardinium]|uniref:hypothetical protein n=1 Tax=unclassified Candidatus Cardinium TaxID=2641185 RepID=UPI001FB3E5F9|nr:MULTISPECIES: hypothetical protein [unclassified Candidatus Cardinium]
MALRLSISRYSFVFLIFFLSLSGCPRNNSNHPVSAACTTSQKTEKKKKTKKKEKNDKSPNAKISHEQSDDKSMLCRCQNNIIPVDTVDNHLVNERYPSDNAIPLLNSNDQVSITNQLSKPAEQNNQNAEVVKDQLHAVHPSSLDLKQKQENDNKKSEKRFIPKLLKKQYKKCKKWKVWSTLKKPFSSKEKVSKNQ